MSMRDLIHGEAELDDEENDESFDEDTGEPIPGKSRANGDLDDSSEEEEDDDDEEAARAVRPSGTRSNSCALFADISLGTRRVHH
jgi:transcription elongation factor SPT6